MESGDGDHKLGSRGIGVKSVKTGGPNRVQHGAAWPRDAVRALAGALSEFLPYVAYPDADRRFAIAQAVLHWATQCPPEARSRDLEYLIQAFERMRDDADHVKRRAQQRGRARRRRVLAVPQPWR